MDTFEIEISTPSGLYFSGSIRQLSLRCISGELSILANHIPYISVIKKGTFKIYQNDNIKIGNSGRGLLSFINNKAKLSVTDFKWV